MPRQALSATELEDFRDTLCESAMELFVEQGYEGVTMRALARKLGCSAMTPYRYFDNKAAIFDAVASRAAAQFADALEASIEGVRGHRERLTALAHAYADFAREHSQAYRIIFELAGDRVPEPEDLRSWRVMHQAVEDAVSDGAIEGDPGRPRAPAVVRHARHRRAASRR